VAERWAAVGEFVEAHPDAVFPVTRKILEGSKGWDAAATFKAQYQLREFARQAEAVWKTIDVLSAADHAPAFHRRGESSGAIRHQRDARPIYEFHEPARSISRRGAGRTRKIRTRAVGSHARGTCGLGCGLAASRGTISWRGNP
jgi:hypothetical protein